MDLIPGSADPPALLRSFEPGIGRVEPWTNAGGANTAYYHADMLGTTRMMTGADGNPLPEYGSLSDPIPATFTAFGERVSGPSDGASNRYGYVGERGYQAHDDMPFLHLGARYYDPSSGRFLQRDPIGIRGGKNVYLYADNRPTVFVDPDGEFFGAIVGAVVGGVVGAVTGGITGGISGAVSGAVGGAVTGALVGQGVPPPVAGAIGGAVGGAIGGAISGGGVGAVTGAVAGAVTGAVSGGIAGAWGGGAPGAVAGVAGEVVGATADFYYHQIPRRVYNSMSCSITRWQAME